jgi:hypothetical protein
MRQDIIAATKTAGTNGSGSMSVVLDGVRSADDVFIGLMVFAAGDVKFTGIDGKDDTWTIPSGALPFLIPIATNKVWTTGTTVAASNIKGIT